MKKLLAVIVGFLFPAAAFAQTNSQFAVSNLNSLVSGLAGTVNLLIPLFLGIAIVVFIYGVVRYILAKGPEGKEGARGYIVWGVIGIAVITALFGITRALVNLFGVGPVQLQQQDIPTIPTQ